MRRNALLRACLVLALGTAACQDQRTEPTDPSDGNRPELGQAVAVDRNQIKLPASVRISDQYFADMARRAVTPTACPASTPLIDWLVGRILEIPAANRNALFSRLADLVPAYDALLFQTEATPQFFGYNGEYNHIMTKVDRDVKRFWDIRSDDIQLVAMHGTMLLDQARVARVYRHPEFTGLPAATANAFALAVFNAMQHPSLNGGNHPILTFNAFALSAPELGIPDKIVMGDGVLDGYRVLGFNDVAPQAVYAHEFGHHIQYENNYFEDPIVTDPATDDAEDTRYTELMADAFSAYYLTHSRGAALNKKRVKQFLQVFFNIGDCAFDNPGHHGTPAQRMRAAQFGFDVADRAQKQGHILPSDAFHDLFVTAYPTFVAP
jgi:hypothetical protein